MVIMGLDPGSRKAGYAAIKQQGKQWKYLGSGVLHFADEKDFLYRLQSIYKRCEELKDQFSPSAIALESLIYVKNVTSMAKLAQARGAMIAAFSSGDQQSKDSLFEYSPNFVKSAITGHGHADKRAVEKSLRLIFGQQLVDAFSSDDESDALAIATCHALHVGRGASSRTKTERTLSRSKGRGLKQALAHKSKGL